jgi:hypothetical protein
VVGTGGGILLEWYGKLGLFAGATRAVDTHQLFLQRLGERFLYCRLEPDDDQFLHASKHIGAKTAQMRQQLTNAVASLFATQLRAPREIDDVERAELNEDLKLAVRLRAAVERDYRTRELDDLAGVEGTGRIGLTLERLLAGLDSLGVERSLAREVVRSITFDSVPPNRLRVYCSLQDFKPVWVTSAEVANVVRLPVGTVRRVIEELVAYNLALKDPAPGTHRWRGI